MAELAARIREVGPASTILATDFGQPRNPPPVEGMEAYVAALVCATGDDTIYTEAFSVGWVGDGPHRVLRSALAQAERNKDEFAGAFDPKNGEEPTPIPRFASHTPSLATTGAIEAMSLWAGESVGAFKRIQPAAEIIREMAGEAEQLLRRWS